MALGDVNSDGFADLAVGAYGYKSGGSSFTGRVYIFYSPGTGGIVKTLASDAATKITGETYSDRFGVSICLGDVNGDGYADLATGASGYNNYSKTDAGRAYIFHAEGTGGLTHTLASGANGTITGQENKNYFGNSVF